MNQYSFSINQIACKNSLRSPGIHLLLLIFYILIFYYYWLRSRVDSQYQKVSICYDGSIHGGAMVASKGFNDGKKCKRVGKTSR